jgi:hypothetical protein
MCYSTFKNFTAPELNTPDSLFVFHLFLVGKLFSITINIHEGEQLDRMCQLQWSWLQFDVFHGDEQGEEDKLSWRRLLWQNLEKYTPFRYTTT